MSSCSLYFFTTAHFHLGGRFKILMFFLQRNSSLLVFLPLALALSRYARHVSLDIKILWVKRDSLCCCFLFLKVWVAMRSMYLKNAQVLKMREFHPGS